MKNKTTLLGAALALAMVASPAFAATLNTGLTSDVNASVTGSKPSTASNSTLNSAATVNSSVGAKTNASVNANGYAQTPSSASSYTSVGTVKAGINAATGVKVQTSNGYANSSSSSTGSSNMNNNDGVNANSNIDQTNSNIDQSTDASGNISISVDGNEVRSNNGAKATVSSAESVLSASDLKAYLETLVSEDSSVGNAEVANNEATLKYAHEAKLFGFIPTTLNDEAHVTVDASGTASVDVSRPWWSLFADNATSSDDFAVAIRARVQSVIMANGKLSASTWAHVLSAIHDAAKETFKSDLGASTNVNASANANINAQENANANSAVY